MDIKGLLDLCFAVLKDWHVIFIAIATIICIALANYVVNYKKKLSAPRPQKTVASSSPAPAKSAEVAEAGEGEE